MKDKAFTLLEVVLVIGILSVLVGAGVIAMVPFKERREILSEAKSLASLMKQTQLRASAVEVPSTCGSVAEFELVYSESEVDLQVKTPGGVICKLENGVLSFSNGTRFTAPGSVVFETPYGSTSPKIISLYNHGIQYDLEINENGSVSKPKKAD